MYRVAHREKGKRRRVIVWVIIIIIILLLLCFLGFWIRQKLQPKATIKQAAAITTKVSYASQTTHYDEPDFGIDLPAAWSAVPRPPHTFQSFTWQNSDKGTDGEQIEIYEDTIPLNFASNRALIVTGEVDHVNLIGAASDNCSTFTKPAVAGHGATGVPAKWQNVDFICDQNNQARDVIGTSSSDGVNTVILRNQSTGASHKFFFTYTNHASNPDYTLFYNAIQSLHMN